MKKIAVVHYLSVEFYPPAMNFLNISSEEKDLKIKVWTTHNNKKRKIYRNVAIDNISRTAAPNLAENATIRVFKYALFNIKCLLGLLFFKPDKILYFESYSVWPVYWYLKLFNKKAELLIHYHEYFSLEWYETGMRLVKKYYQWERDFLYKKAIWISETNEDRIRLFLADNPEVDSGKMRILPNYPPLSWGKELQNSKATIPLKTVYIGTLTVDHSYIKEYCTWVLAQQGEVLFDIYGYNYNAETLDYLKALDSPHINFIEGGVDYNNIPLTLKKYNVGLILYTANDDNYKYNASNKLFEYLACGLQVWYSKKMLGVKPYRSGMVIPVDFEKMDSFDRQNFSMVESIDGLSTNNAEDALKPLLNQLEK
ncbi:hypothetical protein [Aequorivita lipolytica]|uniref:Glycosyltransferase family 4 protein n=1 Tax=Aequorivita lipolytica TaxID=153267 RepID=A0A5C6YN08_9FLAO|nr:hypothetical protein [Aequorivita lipolytica]TXD68590.1 glycosyltransferase family 4 protein [Aequorivita lipolytica]SRX53259.1 hypothetical protein AEQU2_02488 [Aequorivita lipolytica]